MRLYLPFKRRGFYDFGSSRIGDWGSSHFGIAGPYTEWMEPP